jgi:hypothetical protein
MHNQRIDDEDEREFAELQRAAANLPRPPVKQKRNAKYADAFVCVPLWWAQRAAEVTRSPTMFVCLWLLHLSWKSKSLTFPVPNVLLDDRGIDRRAKRRALARLEKAGLISVERQFGKSPIVTLLML